MRFSPLVFLTLLSSSIFSQTTLEVSVIDGNITTTCTDFFSAPNPMWQVNIDGEGWEAYPGRANCFNNLPNLQYQSNSVYGCPKDVPDSIQVCVRAFENDGIFGCTIIESCMVEYCEYIQIIPAMGARNHTITVPSGGDSEGTVELELNITGNFTASENDHICGAIDLGILDFGTTLGDAMQGGYENICAEDFGDVNPRDFDPDSWYLHKGVWFSFTTGPDPSSAIFINQINDPQRLGNSISLQSAAFTTDNNDCDGNLDLIAYDWDFASANDTVFFHCPIPNQKYYILVDGIWTDDLKDGYFGLDVYDPGVKDRGDLICDHVALGPVPPNGEILSDRMSNFCVSNIDDPAVTNFSTEKSVWLSFEAPLTGHISIEGLTQRIPDPIDLEIALFESSDGTCNGTLTERMSVTNPVTRNVDLEISCLTPGETYFILVDGSTTDAEGLFYIKITELIDDTPLTALVETVCASQEFYVGNSIYTVSGNYVDTILLGGGCDSVVFTNLTVLDEVVLDITQTDRAKQLASFTGAANVAVTGGSGNFSYRWSDGQTQAAATNLEGGANYCVTVTDLDGGCDTESCFFVEYITPILPTFTSNDVVCNGESNGTITFSVNNGEPPYDYTWTSLTSNGNGTIASDNEDIVIKNLPSDDYQINVRDIYFDTTFIVTVVQPAQIEIIVDNKIDASCFGVCDGVFGVHGEGGVGNYQFNGVSGGPSITNSMSLLCAGIYNLEMQDGNSCLTSIEIIIAQPDEFIAVGEELQGVTCLGWTDGSGTISSNGRATDYQWETGGSNLIENDLAAGDYLVTVTNQDGCLDTTTVTISEPDDPYLVSISVEEPIQCLGGFEWSIVDQYFGWNNGFV